MRGRVGGDDPGGQPLKGLTPEGIDHRHRHKGHGRAPGGDDIDRVGAENRAAGLGQRGLEHIESIGLLRGLHLKGFGHGHGPARRPCGQCKALRGRCEGELTADRAHGAFLRKELFKAVILVAVDRQARSHVRMAA